MLEYEVLIEDLFELAGAHRFTYHGSIHGEANYT